jgi:hypothetical protein
MKHKLINQFHFIIANKYLPLFKERKPKALVTQQNVYCVECSYIFPKAAVSMAM